MEPSADQQSTCRFRLKDYHISETTGFLLDKALETLPEYFEVWNRLSSIAVCIPLIERHRLRQEVDKMPVLDHTRLAGHREQRLAHLQLAILVNCYVWQDGDEGVPKNLPPCLAIPFCGVSGRLDIQPVLGHCDLALTNWTVIDRNRPLSLENVRVLYSLPGGDEGMWFLKATVGVELAFCPALQPLVRGLEAADTGDAATLEECLTDIAAVLRKMQNALSKMHDGLSAETFYNTTRPFLTGWGGEGSPLPDGLIYEGVNEKPLKMTGGSAAQSSTVQCLDAALGVTHAPEIGSFFSKMRPYMTPPHRQFIEDIDDQTKIPVLVRSSSHPGLQTAYQSCIQALVDFRSYHIQIVTKYIVIASKKQRKEDEIYKSVSNKGTGGSDIIPFLKSARDATRQTDPVL